MHSKTQSLKRTISMAFVAIVMSASSSSALGPSFELLWTLKADPRAKPGMANKEDGITVECVEFSADGKLIAAGNGQGQVKVYNAANGSPVRTLVYTTDPHRDFSTSFKAQIQSRFYPLRNALATLSFRNMQ